VTAPQFPETSSGPITGSDLLPTIQTPTQIIAADHDVFVPWSNAEYLHELLPHSEIRPLDAGHYGWEEKAEEYGRRIVDWVSGGYKRVAG
jgi:pimeloyl-ACP methyl ester carboxylesterase